MSGLCRVLGKSDELLNRALQSLSSSDSMDFSKVLLGNGVKRERAKSDGGKDSVENGSGGGEGKDDGVMSASTTSTGDSSSLSGSVRGGKAEGVRLHNELQSVATHWVSVKATPLCLCGTTFDCQNSRVGDAEVSQWYRLLVGILQTTLTLCVDLVDVLLALRAGVLCALHQ